MAPSATLKSLLKEAEPLAMAIVSDGASVLEAELAGFQALCMMGQGCEAMSYPEMVDRVASLSRVATVPLVCHAGAGFGGLLGAAFTVRGCEAAGASAIVLEDLEKCSRTGLRKALPLEEAATKIRVAVAARSSPDFLIVAHVAASASLGLGEAIGRGRAYAEAGADALFFDSPGSDEELARLGSALGDVPLLVSAAEGGKAPALSQQRCAQLGFRAVILPESTYQSPARASKGTKRLQMTVGLPGMRTPVKDCADAEAAEPPLKKFRTHPGLARPMF